MRWQGGCNQKAGNKDGAAAATQKTQGDSDGDGVDESRRQFAWDRDSSNRETALLMEVHVSASRGDRAAVGGRQRGSAESTRSAVVPAAMVAAEVPFGQEGLPENPGDSSQRDFWGLTESTQLAGLEHAPQGVARLINR